jgi:ubiquinone/menaquinone biosynthesis C-methylase UbiE
LQPEIMDDPALDESQHRAALRGLERINFLSDSAGILWRPIRDLARRLGVSSLNVLDIASGAGDLTIKVWRKAQRTGLKLNMVGCDISATAVEHAQQRASTNHADVKFQSADIFADPLPPELTSQPFDVTMTSLFLHHQDEAHAIELLRRMSQLSQRLVLVNDLRRSTRGWLLAHLAARIFTRSSVVHVDAPRSVEGAFTMAEAVDLARRAGMINVQVTPRWPCRYLLSCEKD